MGDTKLYLCLHFVADAFPKLTSLSKWLFHCSKRETMGGAKLYLGFHFVADAFPKLVSLSKWLFRCSKRETIGGTKLYLDLYFVTYFSKISFAFKMAFSLL
jgi:hypothetical protein